MSSCTAPSRRSSPGTPARRSGAPEQRLRAQGRPPRLVAGELDRRGRLRRHGRDPRPPRRQFPGTRRRSPRTQKGTSEGPDDDVARARPGHVAVPSATRDRVTARAYCAKALPREGPTARRPYCAKAGTPRSARWSRWRWCRWCSPSSPSGRCPGRRRRPGRRCRPLRTSDRHCLRPTYYGQRARTAKGGFSGSSQHLMV